ncbi:hypothetical protein CDV31_011271 [Fusarium ambrosium]|uniref:Protein NO VEIN C-terminal domain-containing protein n=1 Tax=Fusarium ambrosium TaxID=131363 RepID=A0A428THX5_9HYPO|nr:hypothetical protein CDV31_011271 [Fusarium ambrosium]
MNNTATSKAEADAQIEEIRREFGAERKPDEKPDRTESNLIALLDVTSDQLYQKPSHFLLELIQNADDTTFSPGVIPNLSLTLFSESESGYLRTDCNEAGFTFADMDAITQVAHSTKKRTTNGQRGYIGEKGIGFKSVFKAADIVHVASGYYEFMFNRNEHLGMILPIHSTFPSAHRLPGHTQFLLQLRDQKDCNEIEADLHNVEPQLLIFLKNLRGLNIQIGDTRKSYHVEGGTSAALGETATIYSNHQGEGTPDKMIYAIARYRTSEIPKEERRQGITTSEVILAFPIERAKPKIGPQKAFAFLPIDDFGFKFLIHADFLLVASREGLDYGCKWNTALVGAVRKAFLRAVKRFAAVPASHSEGGLRYSWPKYIKHHRHAHDFWNKLHELILTDLRGEKILESRDHAAGPCRPPELKFMPRKFRFEGEAPFDCPSLRRKHLSFNYDGVYEELSLLGVQRIGIYELCEEFSTWVVEVGPSGLDAKPAGWHQHVARLFCGNEDVKDQLMNLPIIPLRDGSWVNARTERLYMASETEDEYVPSGISISIIDEAVCRDSVRRDFYRFLGILAYTPSQVCSLIMELHSGNGSELSDRQPEDLISDAAYFFKHRHLRPRQGAPEIFFYVNKLDSSTRRKTQIYIDDRTAKPRLINKYKHVPMNPFNMLDERYVKTICAEDSVLKDEFYRWLLKSENIAAVPALVRNNYLSAEWVFLRDTKVTDLLLVIEQLCKNNTVHPRVASAIPELQVDCRDGTRRLLGEVAIPTLDLVRACPHLDFANLPTPEKWTFLDQFGIPTAPNTNTRLRELQALSSLPIESVDRDLVHETYRGLSLSLDRESPDILEVFESKALVFVARPHPEWVKHGSCVWSAPSSLKQVTKLSNRYGDCRKLFCNILGVGPASIENVADELCLLQEETSDGTAERCEELLTMLSERLTSGSEFPVTHYLRILHAKVFSVVKATHGDVKSEVVLRSLHDADWYIPDRLTLEAAFRGKVDMLKFSVRVVNLLDSFFSRMNSRNKYLSVAIQETVEPRGSPIHDMSTERDLKIRVEYFSILNPPTDPDQRQDTKPLQVWSVPSVVITRRLGSITVEEDNEFVTFQEIVDYTKVYFRAVTPSSKHAEVNYKLAEFFSRQHDVKPQDINLFNLLLTAPLDELNTIMAKHNRYPPDAGSISILSASDETDPEIMVLDEPSGQFIALERRAPVSEQNLSTFSDQIQAQYSLRDLIPSFQTRFQSVARSARNYRISKRPITRGFVEGRARNERLLHSLQASQARANIPTAAGFPGSSEGAGEDSVPELTSTSTAYQVRTREIGFLGEAFVYALFERNVSDWSFENWTSRLRVENGHPPFTERERDFADFTYLDTHGYVKEFLLQAGLDLNPAYGSRTTYHLEVKTTTGGDGEIFNVSQNQVNMMQRFDDDPNNAYIVLRVYNIEGENPDLKAYPRPWNLYLNGFLTFTSPHGYQE